MHTFVARCCSTLLLARPHTELPVLINSTRVAGFHTCPYHTTTCAMATLKFVCSFGILMHVWGRRIGAQRSTQP